MDTTNKAELIVRHFLEIVRSGEDPDMATEFMANKVLAHQMNAEKQEVIARTPKNYAGHIRDFIRMYGRYKFEITELIAQDNKVYARWKQEGSHLADIDGYEATGLPLYEVGSAVYRVENNNIVEYWMQLDREGLKQQLKHNAEIAAGGVEEKRVPFATAVAHGGMLYISGQVGIDKATGLLVENSFKAEAGQVMKNIGNILQENNLGYNDLVNVTIYLTSIENYAATNEVYLKYFESTLPARACIAVKELPGGANIEIAAIAKYKP